MALGTEPAELICVDASVIVASLLPEELSNRADYLIDRWRNEGTELISPPLLFAEVPDALRRAISRGRISPGQADDLFLAFMQMPIHIAQPPGLVERTWALGKQPGRPRLYDLHYLALAQLQGCPLWTADRRLHRLASPRFSEVRWLGEVPVDL